MRTVLLVLALFLIFGIVGRCDYDAAVVGEQILQDAALNGR